MGFTCPSAKRTYACLTRLITVVQFRCSVPGEKFPRPPSRLPSGATSSLHGLIEATSNFGLATLAKPAEREDWARIAGAFSMPNTIGRASAASPATARVAFLAKPSVTAVRLQTITAIRLLRFDPDTPGNTRQRRFYVELTDVQNARRVNLRVAAKPQHLFVAGTLALLDHPLPDPPHQRMEPKHSYHKHVNGGGKIVPRADVTELMRNDGLHLWRAQSLEDTCRQQQDRSIDPKDPRLQESRRRPYRDGYGKRDGRCGSNGLTDAPPPNPPGEGDTGKSACPDHR